MRIELEGLVDEVVWFGVVGEGEERCVVGGGLVGSRLELRRNMQKMRLRLAWPWPLF